MCIMLYYIDMHNYISLCLYYKDQRVCSKHYLYSIGDSSLIMHVSLEYRARYVSFCARYQVTCACHHIVIHLMLLHNLMYYTDCAPTVSTDGLSTSCTFRYLVHSLLYHNNAHNYCPFSKNR